MTALQPAPIVAHVIRGGFVESVHHGIVVATAPDGSIRWQLGDASAPIFPRSSNKPLQTVAMLRAGLQLSSEQTALATASHSGEQIHLEGVRAMAQDLGVDLALLQNTPDLPYDAATRLEWLRAGREPDRIAQNCSGKHVAMLATCLLNGWEPSTYRDPGHPLQQLVAQVVTELTGDQIAAIAVDGCGAPVMAVTPAGLARAFGRIAAAAEGTPEAQVRDAMRSHPDLVAGTTRDTTILMEGTDGLIAKDGAEAVHAVGLPDRSGLALKIADGGDRARPVVLAAALRRLGLDAEVLDLIAEAPVLGHGEPVGAVVAAPELAQNVN